MKKILLACVVYFTMAVSLALGQGHAVRGTVVDSQTNETLPGVNILVQGTTNGTATNNQGEYSLTVPAGSDTLVFSYIGYKPTKISIDGRDVVDVSLKTQAIGGKELVVVGYGTQRKVNLTGSVGSIDGADISSQPSIQASSALAGKTPGVTVTQSSGQPGKDTGTITIRGTGTLGNANPLVLIDGVQGDLNDVAPSDIANISVLKDAASASIYGSRAANGVILVTTKRGNAGQVRINYNGYVGWQQPTNQPEFVGGSEYMKYYNMALQNLGKDPLYSQEYINDWETNHVSDPDHYSNTDWVDAVYEEPGMQQRQHLSISGGSDIIRYLGSLSYDNQKGNIQNFGYERYSIRLNTDITASQLWHFNFDLNATRVDQQEPSASLENITRQAYRIPPLYAAQYSDGSWGPGWDGQNPLALIHDGGLNKDNNSIFKARIKASYTPVKGLEFSLMYSPEYRDNFSSLMQKQYPIYDIDSKNLLYNYPSTNYLRKNNGRYFTNNLNFTGQYKTSLRDHQFKILGGYEFINNHYDYFSAYRDQFTLQNYEQLDAGSEENQQNSGTATEYALQSLFGRFNYEFRSKYLFEANLRYDGSSRFAKSNRYGLFPSFSAGWRISQEPFMDALDFISNLKIRASWGQLGNQEIGIYPYQAVIDLGQTYLFGGQPAAGAAQLDLANRQISWETTETADVGLDLGLWQDRLSLTFDYYQKNTSDILLRLPVSMTIGMNAPYQNAGKMKNTGWELSTSYQNNIGDLQYNIGFNLSDVHNEVSDLHGAGPFIDGNSITEVGKPLNSIYGYIADGFFDSQEEIDNSATQVGNIAPGDIKYKDLNNDGVINDDDRAVIGDPFPRYSYGINLSANYKGLDFAAFFQGVGKRDVLLRGDAVWAFQNAGKMRKWQKDYWTPDNKNASYPRLVATTTHSDFENSSFWVYNASYLRLRNLEVGYTLPVKWTRSLSIRKLRVYFLGQNLFTGLDDMPPGVDPNVSNGTDGAYYPITKVYTFGLDLAF